MVMIMFGMFQTGWLYLMNYLIWFNAHINPTNYQMVLLFPLLEENGCLTMSSIITSQTTGKQKNLHLDRVVLIPSVQVQCPYSMLYRLQHRLAHLYSRRPRNVSYCRHFILVFVSNRWQLKQTQSKYCLPTCRNLDLKYFSQYS